MAHALSESASRRPKNWIRALDGNFKGMTFGEYDDPETSRPVSTSSGVESASTSKAYA
jgi:hypothetical protein